MRFIRVLILGVVLPLFTGCEECMDITCYNGGVCVEEICDCVEGYEGPYCQMEVRSRFFGIYNVSGIVECSDSTNSSFDALMTIGASESGVRNIYLNLLGITLTAATSRSSFNIIPFTQGDYTYTGSGSRVGTSISFVINEENTSISQTCIYTLTGQKQ
jgi:hypothetical protein